MTMNIDKSMINSKFRTSGDLQCIVLIFTIVHP